MNKKDIYLWLLSIGGIGNKTIEKIEDSVDNIEQLMDLPDKDILKIENLNLNIKQNIVKYKSRAYIDSLKEDLYKHGVSYIGKNESTYPSKLRHIYNAPSVLFYKGDINQLDKLSLAMVGSRKPTSYGIWCAQSLSEKLSNYNINIVSGMAMGIDEHSHKGCIKGSSKTIAVLGSSVENPLPKKNLNLSNKILEEGGLLVSEYNVGHPVAPSNYPARNRIISGLSDGVIVVEATKKSGALITVDFALEQGKNVFAIPGNINSDMSKGCHMIIKDGAKLVDDIEDIINEYNLKKFNKIANDSNSNGLTYVQQSIFDIIETKGSLHIDRICDYTNMNIQDINCILNMLEIEGKIIEMRNKIYSVK
ncbi:MULTISPECIES: DNA-processing protein DprA [Paraclostridium]|uniref:DNA polymerase III subunit beta n=1 Tax=Paraclostridium benzoelyticum TaxID=1629550 RepID=A0A0M3DHE5_9FIRM|nr:MULTISPECIES: DNA-processing protein DprA [Paraclostridium]KKY01743.1 DNA polymerase III subunit beta [Paraclostridium benzoelyticum]MCU9813832.1 DNA-processing protein DprA [Paraclostridium sp. AKS73]MDM8127727.1 DNA-processing protein DprA [Paraclostridium benzoelyticum]OXX83947.1 DNA processing protein DprA [Paraclostridium benzoelyticum]